MEKSVENEIDNGMTWGYQGIEWNYEHMLLCVPEINQEKHIYHFNLRRLVSLVLVTELMADS